MSLTLRIFLAYFLLVGAGLMVFLYSTYDQLRPVVRQTSEETLVDTANLLAEFAPPLLVSEAGSPKKFLRAVHDYRHRQLKAKIWSHEKDRPSFTLYVTDTNGAVVFHTDRSEIGKDYSGWLDVSRTLEGRYGARTTPSSLDKVLDSTMYVAAPVYYRGRLVGELTVGQPNRSIQPFLEYARGQILQLGTIILIIALLLGGALALWLTRSIQRLVQYVEDVRDGDNTRPPALREPELARLAESTESMRRELEGKRYVEQYIQNLTHEMKSPLSAVRGAVEILQEGDAGEQARTHFLDNIDWESRRMQQLIDRLLALASLENRHGLAERETVDLNALLAEELERKTGMAQERRIHVAFEKGAVARVSGEAFLLRQALGNLIDNALDFCKPGGTLAAAIRRKEGNLIVDIENEGEPIPDYALPRLFERFYSLSRPGSRRKSTGLGLSFVREIADLHAGRVEIDNTPTGVRASLILPPG